MESRRKKLRPWYCGHCDKVVSKSTFYSHRRRYYDKKTRKWSKTQLFLSNESEERRMLDCRSDSELSDEDDEYVPGFDFEDPLHLSSESEQGTDFNR